MHPVPPELPELDLRSVPEYRIAGQSHRKFRSRKGWEMLALLAQQPGSPLARASVAAELWPDDPMQAAPNLRRTLCYIKDALPDADSWLHCSRSEVLIDPTKVRILGGRAPGSEYAANSQWAWFANAKLDPFPLQQALIGLSPLFIESGQLRLPLERSKDVLSHPELVTPEFRIALAELYAAAGNFRLAESYLREGATRDGNNPELRARRLLIQSLIDARLLAYSSAQPLATEALKLADQLKNHELAIRALTVLAYCAYALDRPEEVPALAKRGLHLCRLHGRTVREAQLHHALMCAYQRLGKDSAARQVIQSSLRTIRKTPAAVHGIIVARFGRGLESYGKDQQAAELFREALELLEGTDYVRETAETRTYLGDWHYDQGQYEEAHAQHIAAAKIRRTMPEPLALATSLRGAGAAALALLDLETAERTLSESMKLSQMANSEVGTGSAAALLARTIALKGDHRKAAKLLDTALRLLSTMDPAEYSLRLPAKFPTRCELEDELRRLKTATR